MAWLNTWESSYRGHILPTLNINSILVICRLRASSEATQ